MPAAGVVPASGAYDQITWDFITWAKMVAPPRRRPLGSGCHSSVDQPASHRASHGLYLLDVLLGGLVRGPSGVLALVGGRDRRDCSSVVRVNRRDRAAGSVGAARAQGADRGRRLAGAHYAQGDLGGSRG